ncbi:uncharacterized protein LOC123668515 [Melitaea cinxia]|uniref:uncharacterized protein LOC123668515 n=1 Tax=Melitaea cinxia TaxID=113334 RepID=UPI001E2711B1|nr:uncharacterized protein LOC123668515 [Melitaea cinxia]
MLKKSQSMPKREALSVDEQICATKASKMLRQYLPNKPQKWGFKLLVLCDDRGFVYDFKIYIVMENNSDLRLPNEPDLAYSQGFTRRQGKSIQIPSLEDLESSKKKRGYSEKWVGNVNGTDIVTVMWYDNKPVVLSSSFVGKYPTQKKSWGDATKSYTAEIERLQSLKYSLFNSIPNSL